MRSVRVVRGQWKTEGKKKKEESDGWMNGVKTEGED